MDKTISVLELDKTLVVFSGWMSMPLGNHRVDMLKKEGGSALLFKRVEGFCKSISMDWNKFKEFLRSLGVEMEGSDAYVPQTIPEEPIMRILQRAHDHEAFYRIDLCEETGPELLVLLPNNQTPLKFSFYRVQLSEGHPLSDVMIRLMNYQGSEGFEQGREVQEWHFLHAVGETMKVLFWAGEATLQFPPEIVVHKIC